MMDMIDSMYNPEFFRQAGHRLVDQLADYLLAARMASNSRTP